MSLADLVEVLGELEDEGVDWSDDTTPATTLAIVFASKGGDPPELAIIARLTPKRCIIKRMDVRTRVD